MSNILFRRGWLSSLGPVRAIEDKLSRLDLEEGAEVGQELDDEVDNEVKFWDIPMAFNSPRHLEVHYRFSIYFTLIKMINENLYRWKLYDYSIIKC